jgi:hypothetical protein
LADREVVSRVSGSDEHGVEDWRRTSRDSSVESDLKGMDNGRDGGVSLTVESQGIRKALIKNKENKRLLVYKTKHRGLLPNSESREEKCNRKIRRSILQKFALCRRACCRKLLTR